MDGRPPSHTAPKRTYTQPTSADFPIRSIIENITSSLPSFGVPPSSQDPARPNTAPIPHNHPVPKSAPYTSSSSSWWPFGASSSTRSASVPAQRPTGSKPWRTYLPSDPALSGALSGSAAVVVTLAGIWGYRRYGRRIRNADYVTSKMLERKTWVRGVVTSVGDGDNFRLFHTPLFYRYPFKFRSIPGTPKELKNETLHIRISGVDAPEAAHFGNPAQAHSAESLEWLRKTILGRTMKVQLLRKDQYQRIVGVPYISRLILRDQPLPMMMLKEGMAVVYTSGGGEYGPWGLDGMQAVEAEAKKAKRGLWGLKTFEHPADYKKRVKAGEEAVAEVQQVVKGERRGIWGFITRILG